MTGFSCFFCVCKIPIPYQMLEEREARAASLTVHLPVSSSSYLIFSLIFPTSPSWEFFFFDICHSSWLEPRMQLPWSADFFLQTFWFQRIFKLLPWRKRLDFDIFSIDAGWRGSCLFLAGLQVSWRQPKQPSWCNICNIWNVEPCLWGQLDRKGLSAFERGASALQWGATKLLWQYSKLETLQSRASWQKIALVAAIVESCNWSWRAGKVLWCHPEAKTCSKQISESAAKIHSSGDKGDLTNTNWVEIRIGNVQRAPDEAYKPTGRSGNTMFLLLWELNERSCQVEC